MNAVLRQCPASRTFVQKLKQKDIIVILNT
jgi:hypothetical protein